MRTIEPPKELKARSPLRVRLERRGHAVSLFLWAVAALASLLLPGAWGLMACNIILVAVIFIRDRWHNRRYRDLMATCWSPWYFQLQPDAPAPTLGQVMQAVEQIRKAQDTGELDPITSLRAQTELYRLIAAGHFK